MMKIKVKNKMFSFQGKPNLMTRFSIPPPTPSVGEVQAFAIGVLWQDMVLGFVFPADPSPPQMRSAS